MPQNQKTKPTESLDDLPLLSTEEERLVEAWAQGHGQAVCYRMAYGAEGYGVNSLAVRACRKFAEPRIQAHLRALQATGLAKIKLNVEERLAQELAFAQRAENAGNFGAAGGAQDRVNKLLGLYVEKTQSIPADTDPVAKLRDIERKHGPEIAIALAAKHGITDWQPSETRH